MPGETTGGGAAAAAAAGGDPPRDPVGGGGGAAARLPGPPGPMITTWARCTPCLVVVANNHRVPHRGIQHFIKAGVRGGPMHERDKCG